MNDKKVPNHYQLSDIQKSTRRSLVIDHGYSFVFSTDMRDWITQRGKRQQLKSRKRIKNGENKRNYKKR